MKTWAEFYDDLLPDVPMCPRAMAQKAVKDAAQQFFERTLAWVADTTDITIAADTISYTIPLTTGTKVVQIMRATLDDAPLDVLTERDLPSNWQTAGVVRRGVFTLDRKTVYIVPQQSAGAIAVLQVALKPADSATGIDDEMFEHYSRVISTGAAAILMDMPKKPYTDHNLAAKRQAQFDSDISTIAWQVAKSHGRAAVRSKASFF